MLAVVLAAQLSHPPSRSGWLADEVILGASFTGLSVRIKRGRRFVKKVCMATVVIHHMSSKQAET